MHVHLPRTGSPDARTSARVQRPLCEHGLNTSTKRERRDGRMRETRDVYFAFMARFLNRYSAHHYLPFWQDFRQVLDWVLLSCHVQERESVKRVTT